MTVRQPIRSMRAVRVSILVRVLLKIEWEACLRRRAGNGTFTGPGVQCLGREIIMLQRRPIRYRWRLLDAVQLVAVACVALSMAPTLGGALSLPGRLHLAPADYVIAQRLDHSALFVGLLGVLALAATALHAFLVRGSAAAFAWSTVAVSGLAAAQIVFWLVAFPTLRQTDGWTVMPEDFETARRHWEFALAAAGGLCLGALLASVRAVQASRPIASLAILESIERDAAVRAARARALAIENDKRHVPRDAAA